MDGNDCTATDETEGAGLLAIDKLVDGFEKEGSGSVWGKGEAGGRVSGR